MVRDRPELNPPPRIIWRYRTDSDNENTEVAPLMELGYELHFNSGKLYFGNASEGG